MRSFFILILGFVLLGFIYIFIKNLLQADPGIAAAIIGAISVTTLGIWTHYSNCQREINSRHFIEKKKAYMIFIELMFDFIKAEKNDKKIKEEDITKRLYSFKKELLVWGNQEVIKAMFNYERNSLESSIKTSNKEESTTLTAVDDLLKAMRKDLGHNDSNLERGSLVGMLIKADERDKMIENKKKDKK